MKTALTLAFNEITERFGLSRETVMEALEAAMVSAYRRSVSAPGSQLVEAKIDLETGAVRISAEKEVVESVQNPQTETLLEEARTYDPEVELGDMAIVESTPPDFGRVAAQTAKQVILQRLREAERDAQYDEFVEREGDMVHGTVHSITPQAVTVGLGRAEAILPRNQQIPREQFHVRDRIRVYVLEVRKSSRGPVIVVSRTHPNMLRRLLEMEVPEINQGLVEIKAIAREAGKRSKVAVAATREGIDPVGACVGMRGVRIQSIVRDLNDEKIDVIEWNSDSATFIAKALSPARVSGVFLDEDPERGKTAMVVVPEDQLSLAIGRAGVNARLGARLTGWRIDIKSLTESASESLQRLQTSEEFADQAVQEAEVMPQVEAILAKKAEGRPVMPEEYQLLGGFVSRVQLETHSRRQAERLEIQAKLEEIREQIPSTAYETPLEEVGLKTRILNLLTEANFETAGHVLEQLGVDEDKILALQGFGPKSLSEVREVLEAYEYPEPSEPVVEEAPEEALVEEPVGEEVPEAVEIEAIAEEAEAMEAVEPEAEPLAEAAVEEIADEAEGEVEAEAVDEAAIEEREEPETIEEVPEIFAESEIDEMDDERLEELERETKKRKARGRIVEFDPELGEMVVKRRRKRDDEDDWEKFKP
ncbi:MAG TPA: transcription termination/antitermination protein NusA [Anaerolineae bacterium]|nr:transcription termination/antitermination protein NusA [Anaerolineae bacterium]